jgi:uncharacterized protein
MRLTRFATCLAALALFLALPAFAQAKVHRVLFALTSSDPADWNLTVGNVQNLTAGVAPDEIQVEIVAYGPGILFLKSDSAVAADLKGLQAVHVRLVACGNAMRARHLTPADLVTGVEVVPAGIVEVVRKQEEGWSYIKAGR